jgi:hypothetical protein
VLVNVLGQLGQNASVAELGDAVADIDVPPDLRQQQLVLLARCVSQLVYAYERQTASGLLDRIRALEEASDALDARTVAYIARARSDSAYLVGDLTEAFRQSDFAIAKFDSAGMVRERMFLQMLAHTFFGFVGRPDESLRALRAIAEEAEAMGLAYLRGFARYEVGLIEGLYGLPNACAHLDRAFADVRGSVRLEFGGGTARAIAAIHAGALDDALAALDAIRNHRVAPELRVKAVALEAFILARRGRADEALALLDGMRNDAVAILDPPWGIEDLAEVEARAVRGERALAKDALSRGIAKLEAKLAGTGIVDLDYRIVPLVGPRFVELAREFGLEPR